MGKTADLAATLQEDFEASDAPNNIEALRQQRRAGRELGGRLVNMVGSFKSLLQAAEDQADTTLYRSVMDKIAAGLLSDVTDMNIAEKAALKRILKPMYESLG